MRVQEGEDGIGVPACMPEFKDMDRIVGKQCKEVGQSRIVAAKAGRQLIEDGAEGGAEVPKRLDHPRDRLGAVPKPFRLGEIAICLQRELKAVGDGMTPIEQR